MGKRHQASRRRAYGRRQHEVRERIERPTQREVDASGISVFETGPFDGLDGSLVPAELSMGGRMMQFVAD